MNIERETLLFSSGQAWLLRFWFLWFSVEKASVTAHVPVGAPSICFFVFCIAWRGGAAENCAVAFDVLGWWFDNAIVHALPPPRGRLIF